MESEVDAFADRDLHQPVDDLLVVLPQDHVGAVDESHVAAELMEDAGELIGDIAATGNDYPLGQRWEVEHLVRADRMFDAIHRRHDRRRARGDQDLFRRDFLAAREPN